MNKVKFGLVGCGSIGKRHIAVLDSEKHAELIAICDTDEEALNSQLELYPYLKGYTNLEEMLAEEELDVVNIATPHGNHCQSAKTILNYKRHVLVEKPMALSSEECDEMIELANRNCVRLFVVKQNRYNKPIALTRQAIEDGRLGKLFMVQCNVMWNRHQSYYNDSVWRGIAEMEGGALFTQVSHFIDLLIWWFGDLVEAKTLTETMNHDIEIEDCGVTALKFNNGALGSIFWTTCVYNKNFEGSITIIGEKGTIKIGGQYLNKIDYWDVESYPLPDNIIFEDKPNNYGKYKGTSSNHDKLISHIVEELSHNLKGLVEGEDAKKTVSTIELIYKG